MIQFLNRVADCIFIGNHSVFVKYSLLHIWTASLMYDLWASAGLMGIMISR